jgi:hypothetical protein
VVTGVPILLGALGAVPALGDVLRVTITTPVPPRIETAGIRRVLVTRFLVDKDLPDLDLNRELVSLLRREMRKKTTFEILDVEPPSLPEQPLRDLLANNGFWRRMAETHGADLVITGVAGFEVSDRSGFVQQDEISPYTGQRVRRTRYVEREAFNLRLDLFFIQGSTGKLLYEDQFKAENTVVGGGTDRLAALYGLFEQFEEDILGIVVPKAKQAQRYLFTE